SALGRGGRRALVVRGRRLVGRRRWGVVLPAVARGEGERERQGQGCGHAPMGRHVPILPTRGWEEAGSRACPRVRVSPVPDMTTPRRGAGAPSAGSRVCRARRGAGSGQASTVTTSPVLTS